MMKTWNAPKMVELNIAATANGWWDIDWEGCTDGWFTDGEDHSSNPDKSDKTNQES